jgi:O6-methylguanine-DNA--protein-cysteine methyltransferase
MPRSDEAEAFFYGVYAAVQEIPHGRVTTYGHIAALIGTRTYLSSHPHRNDQPVPLSSN